MNECDIFDVEQLARMEAIRLYHDWFRATNEALASGNLSIWIPDKEDEEKRLNAYARFILTGEWRYA